MIELGTLEDWGIHTTHCVAMLAQTHTLFSKSVNAVNVYPFLFPLSYSFQGSQIKEYYKLHRNKTNVAMVTTTNIKKKKKTYFAESSSLYFNIDKNICRFCSTVNIREY